MAFALDSMDWLRFLADEWWVPSDGESGIRLGVEAVCGDSAQRGSPVVVWVDSRLLPALSVAIHGKNGWREGTTKEIVAGDTEIHLSGPIPLAAVTAFSVSSEKGRARLMAMSQSYSNVGLSLQPIEVRAANLCAPAPGEPPIQGRYCPPRKWDAIRGAAAMALYAVPLIDPWLDVFCESLSTDSPHESAATALGAPWLAAPMWERSPRNVATMPLWASICEILGAVSYRDEWRPSELVDTIVETAIDLGANAGKLDELREHTHALLLDRVSIDARRAQHDPLGLALQLVLLRPTVDQYVTWLEDQRSMPPAVWWTGAMLSGLITGLRDLDPQYRGPRTAREFLAVRTWRLFGGDGATASWPDLYGANLSWALSGEKIQFADDTHAWAERKPSRRGEWFRANFDDLRTYQAALELSKRMQPSTLRRCIRIADAELPFSGGGKISVDKAGTKLKVKGSVNIALSNKFSFEDELDVDQFRDWIVVGSVAESLPPVPESGLPAVSDTIAAGHVDDSSSQDVAHKQALSNPDDPPGLSLVPDFISQGEEQFLLDQIDQSVWLTDLSRRVQHYGWKYDYRARSVESTSYLGPLPKWAAELANRLVKIGLVSEKPDQVIVNEYVGNQGIGKHVDCPECFNGPIVTVSLGESWTMQFVERNGSRKVGKLLPRYSAAVLDGEVRSNWTHEIPKLKKEGSVVRGRRVSITFRKVIPKNTKPKRQARQKVIKS
ncbi:alpha-ketoglutarate-dependent dioxygenase AlkB [Paraburkholderia sp. SEWSISQ10-3 4]|nr:alpha-ketoglutarate-dependent dioxygenase AlkB [Paraburkholderia aspalathi]MDN7173166.1 alpha-ketoglutarate-dependent dioxygenase AlkB [Paraburkholderia sp. SEWSISQ10-3 4]MDQ6502807.1 alpha-ketoglutarate-dependent dioxygenase AlkB [Paraburkholderia aspalathi]